MSHFGNFHFGIFAEKESYDRYTAMVIRPAPRLRRRRGHLRTAQRKQGYGAHPHQRFRPLRFVSYNFLYDKNSKRTSNPSATSWPNTTATKCWCASGNWAQENRSDFFEKNHFYVYNILKFLYVCTIQKFIEMVTILSVITLIIIVKVLGNSGNSSSFLDDYLH